MDKRHSYRVDLEWTGNTGTGTATHRSYERAYDLSAEGKPVIAGSSDRAFRGDSSRWNPEEFLLGALASCHLLSYLHLCAEEGIVVLAYADHSEGLMEQTSDGGGRFTRVTLRPVVKIADAAQLDKAQALHAVAHEKCFIANSVNFPVGCEASILG